MAQNQLWNGLGIATGMLAAGAFGLGALESYHTAQEERGRQVPLATTALQFVGDQRDILRYSVVSLGNAVATTGIIEYTKPTDLPPPTVSELTKSTDMQIILMIGSFFVVPATFRALKK
jgi:hypothetical protein